MVIAMFGGMIGEGVMKKGKTGNQYSVQRSRDFQQRWAYYLESLRSRRYSKLHNTFFGTGGKVGKMSLEM